MIVERQEPKKSRIISAVRTAAIQPSRTTSMMAARTKIDWSCRMLILTPGGSVSSICGKEALTASTTLSVEDKLVLKTVSRTAGCPFALTSLT